MQQLANALPSSCTSCGSECHSSRGTALRAPPCRKVNQPSESRARVFFASRSSESSKTSTSWPCANDPHVSWPCRSLESGRGSSIT